MLTINQVSERLSGIGLPASVRTISRWVESGDFPAPVKINARVYRWREEEVDAWIESKRNG